MSSTHRLIRRASPFAVLSILALAAMAFCAPRVDPVPEPRGLMLEPSPPPPILPAPVSAAPAGTPVKGLDLHALAELVAATSFREFGNSTEGTVLAYFDDLLNDRDPAQVWVVEKGALRDSSTKDLGSQGKEPPYTLLFGVTQRNDGRYQLVVKTWYDMGLFPDSRGGNEQVWQIALQDGRWVVLDRETTMNWD